MITKEMTWNEKWEAHQNVYDKVREDNEFTTIWSCYNVDDNVTNFDETLHADIQVLKYEGMEIKVAPNPTWLDLWKYGEILYHAKIGKLNYGHDHMFIEAFQKVAPGVYKMYTGS